MSQSAYHDYEAAKRFWVKANPSASTAEYEAACARLAAQYGI